MDIKKIEAAAKAAKLLLRQIKIGKKRVTEEIGDAGRVMLQFPHERLDFMRDILSRVGQMPGMD